MNRKLVIIAHDIRSTHNVGSILRTADGLGVEHVYLTGYTPYPLLDKDSRLPYIALKLSKQISKTALGAEKSDIWSYNESIKDVIETIKQEGYEVACLEQSPKSIKLNNYSPPQKIALIIGREVEGIEESILEMSETILEIPMNGKKESFNVSVATGIAAYHILNVPA